MEVTEYKILRDKDRTIGLTFKDFNISLRGNTECYTLKQELAKNLKHFCRFECEVSEEPSVLKACLSAANRSMYDAVYPVQEVEKEYL